MITVLACVSLVLAAIPAYFYFRNVEVFAPLPAVIAANADSPVSLESPVSVLIPARNESANIADCVAAVLAGAGDNDEVLVLDDHSDDGTGQIVTGLAEQDARVRLLHGVPLPMGWNGKQHACWQLAQQAKSETLIFLDADVRLEPDALPRIKRAAATGADLLGGFPRQITRSLVERMLIPLIHFVLLGFLSLRHLRRVQKPEFAAGCGQLFVTNRRAYQQAGGHAAIRASRHDGIKLPRLYLEQGLSIDVFDATDVAKVRMYEGAAATWRGLAKNADEGVACPRLIVPVTAMLIGGQVAPLGLVATAIVADAPAVAEVMAVVALGLAYLPRLDATRRFRQPVQGALLHPLAVLVFLAIQWWSLLSSMTGRQVEWKGRPAAST